MVDPLEQDWRQKQKTPAGLAPAGVSYANSIPYGASVTTTTARTTMLFCRWFMVFWRKAGAQSMPARLSVSSLSYLFFARRFSAAGSKKLSG